MWKDSYSRRNNIANVVYFFFSFLDLLCNRAHNQNDSNSTNDNILDAFHLRFTRMS